MFDVSFFLGTNLEIDVRRNLEGELVSHYYTKLVEFGVQGYSYEQVRDGRESNRARGLHLYSRKLHTALAH